MFRIDNATAVPSGSGIPTPAAPGPRPNGYFTVGSPAGPVPATTVDADWLNCIQEEICTVIAAASITLNKASQRNLLDALTWLIGRRGLAAFTSSGSWTCPAGVYRVKDRVWGGGGGGGGCNGTAQASGGSGGGYSEGSYVVVPGTVYTVTVGLGGLGGSGAPSNGASGGTSSFASFNSATGGGPGFGSASGGQGTTSSGGTGAGGTINLTGTSGSGGNPNIFGGSGGGSPMGIAGAPVGAINGASSGFSPGGGGGGAAGFTGGFAGGTGGGGLVILEW
jgi:hypothetical protein